jgi:hypothetical protein
LRILPQAFYCLNGIPISKGKGFIGQILEVKLLGLPFTSLFRHFIELLVKPPNIMIRKSKFLNDLIDVRK